jgi:hypothetical protein
MYLWVEWLNGKSVDQVIRNPKSQSPVRLIS